MSKTIPVIILLGAPGAGKGTQSSYLAKEKGIPKISTGDMLRHAVQDDSPLGKKVKEIMSDGKLVDDQTMLDLMKERISKSDTRNGFILDGYPRNLHQAKQLESILTPEMKLCVVELKVSEEEIVKRVAGRRTCPNCSRIYNMYYHPPADDQKCDADGEKLFMRNDDSEDVVRRRIELYNNETYPLIDHYRMRGMLHVVDGVQSEADVTKFIFESVAS